MKFINWMTKTDHNKAFQEKFKNQKYVEGMEVDVNRFVSTPLRHTHNISLLTLVIVGWHYKPIYYSLGVDLLYAFAYFFCVIYILVNTLYSQKMFLRVDTWNLTVFFFILIYSSRK